MNLQELTRIAHTEGYSRLTCRLTHADTTYVFPVYGIHDIIREYRRGATKLQLCWHYDAHAEIHVAFSRPYCFSTFFGGQNVHVRALGKSPHYPEIGRACYDKFALNAGDIPRGGILALTGRTPPAGR